MVAAPMSGVTDEAFRLMLLKNGRPDVFWTEFVSADGLVSEKGRKYCLEILKFNLKERPIVAQIFGGNPANFKTACKMVAKLGFDGIDIIPDGHLYGHPDGVDIDTEPALITVHLQYPHHTVQQFR